MTMCRAHFGAEVEVVQEDEPSEFGTFAWVVDCNGRQIELCQPPAGH